jgi:polar amino acid transport system ATP-binding protein
MAELDNAGFRDVTAKTTPMIRFDRVSKSFGTTKVLDELVLEVSPGEKLAVIGPSGSGKTTILRLLMTLEQPDAGIIEVDGEPLWHEYKGDKLVPASERHLRMVRTKIGMVFQQFNLFPHMKVLRNVMEAQVRVLGTPRDEAEVRARNLLDMVGLSHKCDAFPSQLSGGQQQRVAIARALALKPKVMLFDEVTSALDPELVGEVLRVLRDLTHSRDMTMLIVTHEIRFARESSDRVVMFDHGKIIEAGTPELIFTKPSHERTREFLHAVLERE